MSDLRIDVVNGDLDITGDIADKKALTGSLSNAVSLSLFVAPYWANRVAAPADRYSSRLKEISRGTVGVETARDTAAAARSALEWMSRSDVAAVIDVRAEIASRERINLRVGISEGPRDRQEYVYGLNWAATEAEV